jgi:hypothetical protein
MERLFLLTAGIVTLGLYFVVAPVFVDTYRRYRNRKTIICPDAGQIAEVEVKALHAGLMSVLGKHQARVKWCSLWPRKKGCAEDCVKEDWWSRE